MLDEITFPTRLYPIGDKATSGFAYLTEKEKLQEIVADLCKKLHHPVALIDYNALNDAEITDKLESTVEMFPMRRSCSVFRKCAGDNYCTECDIFHAKCMENSKAAIEKRIQNNVANVPDYFYPGYIKRLPKVLDGFTRPVVEYHCPMLGYRELLFPLMYQGKIYGVLFAGQIMVIGQDQQIIKEISTSFFKKKKPEELFENFVVRYNAQDYVEKDLDSNRIREMIITSDENAEIYDDVLSFKRSPDAALDYYSKSFRSQEEYITFIGNVCTRIEETEKKITELYKKHTKLLITNELSSIADKFYENFDRIHERIFQNKHDLRTEELAYAWDSLRLFANEIKQRFSLVDMIIMYGDGQRLRIEDSSKKNVVFTVPDSKEYLDESFDFSLGHPKGLNNHDNSLKHNNILEGLSENLPKENSILVQCDDIAMLILVKDLKKQPEFYESLADAIGDELTKINDVVALCTANLLKEKYLLTLRMYRHESAHTSTRLMSNINRYLSNNGQRFLNTTNEKRQRVYNDMKNTVQLISNIADNIGFVTGSSIPEGGVARFDVVDMLYKWQIMFQGELENRNLDISIYRGGYDSSTVGFKLSEHLKGIIEEITLIEGDYTEAPREIIVNSRLFELLVYNIVDNAVKYAYRGTNIYLIWCRNKDDYELFVTSYGPYMKEDDSMYRLYVRGTFNQSNPRQGDGLGLYVVKQIAEKLGIRVTHNCKRISKYNVPLIPWYQKTDFSRIKGYSKVDDSELIKHDNVSQASLAINEYEPTKIKEDDLTPIYLCRRIKMETCRTTFRIRIPVKIGK